MFTRKEILLRKLRFVVLIVISSCIYTQAFAEQQDSNKEYYQIEAIRGPEETLWIANFITGLLWQVNKNIDISIVGQNLLDRLRPEFGNDNVMITEPKHAIFVKLTWRF